MTQQRVEMFGVFEVTSLDCFIMFLWKCYQCFLMFLGKSWKKRPLSFVTCDSWPWFFLTFGGRRAWDYAQMKGNKEVMALISSASWISTDFVKGPFASTYSRTCLEIYRRFAPSLFFFANFGWKKSLVKA